MNGLAFSLSQFPSLAEVDGQALQAIAARAHERTFRAGQMIVLAGEPSGSVYLLERGRVRSQRCSTEGREFVLHDLGPGECFNLASVLDGGYNLSTVTAVSDVVVYAVPAREVVKSLRVQGEAGVDQHRTTVGRRPTAVLYVLGAVDNQMGPGLPDGKTLHEVASSTILISASVRPLLPDRCLRT